MGLCGVGDGEIGFMWRGRNWGVCVERELGLYGESMEREREREKLGFLRLELRVVYCNLSYFLIITNLFKKRKKYLKKT